MGGGAASCFSRDPPAASETSEGGTKAACGTDGAKPLLLVLSLTKRSFEDGTWCI